MQQLQQAGLLTEAGVSKPIIFFDGVCAMCNTFVDLILRLDRRQQFLFAPLGGETSRKNPAAPRREPQELVDGLRRRGRNPRSVRRIAGSLPASGRDLESPWPGPVRPAGDPQSDLSCHCREPLSMVWQTRNVPAADRRGAGAVPRLSRSSLIGAEVVLSKTRIRDAEAGHFRSETRRSETGELSHARRFHVARFACFYTD